ncbi:MAG TPA: alpha/beta fold hydrolase [Streptosporangiaceae bacterium]|jgi:pimeloyl-ACP methyl ester carboxylesterase|nr:alpha/beta fold hydrolase [Streptosporangiaceae bacterium]
MAAEKVTVRTAAGRQLDALAIGPREAPVVVLHNGTPAGLVECPPLAEAAAGRGLRLVLYSRPGYGGSTPDPGRRVADAAADVAAVLDGLGVARFVTVGWSGGGPHALACAARLPGRCTAAATMAGVAPYPAEGLDWMHGMGAENIGEFRAALAGAEALTSFLEPAAREMAAVTGADVAAGLGDLVSAADKAAVTGEFADYLAASFRAAVAGGVAGWRDDDLAFTTDWGFTMAEAGQGAPVAVWQGDQDMMVPWPHGQWLAAQVPGARAHLLPGEGHLTLVHTFGAILDDLLDMAGRPG